MLDGMSPKLKMNDLYDEHDDEIIELYCRLSQEDSLDGESNSVTDQKKSSKHMPVSTASQTSCFSWTMGTAGLTSIVPAYRNC